ncbi:MAG: hypothetical protein GY760_15990 [Deltaproteobacteria bacterium]|nr:hypothetical protein [Deltaproteobacteria bacterium]
MAITQEQIEALVQDTTGLLTDDDYTTIISIESNLYRAAALAARMLAAKYAGKTKLKAGPVTIEAQQKYEHYIDLAQKYDNRASSGGGGGNGSGSEFACATVTGISIDEMNIVDSDTDRFPSTVRKGQFNNPPYDDRRTLTEEDY